MEQELLHRRYGHVTTISKLCSTLEPSSLHTHTHTHTHTHNTHNTHTIHTHIHTIHTHNIHTQTLDLTAEDRVLLHEGALTMRMNNKKNIGIVCGGDG